ENQHRQSIRDHRRVLPRAVERERVETKEGLAGDVAVEVETETRLVPVSRGHTPYSNCGVAHPYSPPLHVSRVVGIVLEMRVQVLPVPRVHVNPEVLQRTSIQQRVDW